MAKEIGNWKIENGSPISFFPYKNVENSTNDALRRHP
jgi:hypothetical protein